MRGAREVAWGKFGVVNLEAGQLSYCDTKAENGDVTMNSFGQSDSTRHEYRLKTRQRMLYMILGMGFAAFGVFFAWVSTASATDRTMPVIIGLASLAFAALMLAQVARSRLVIQGSRIEVRDVFSERTGDLSEIEGYRTVRSRNGTYTKLCLKDGRGTITLSRSFDTDDDFRAWFNHVPDLDKRGRETLLSEISQQAELGATPEERLGALATAKTWSIFTVIVAAASAVGLNLGPDSLFLPSAVVLALIPFAVLLLVQRSPLLYAVLKQKADPRAELIFALLVASFGFIPRIRGFHLVSVQPLLLIIVPIALVYTGAIYSFTRKDSVMLPRAIAVLFLAGLYSYGLTVVSDTQADHSPATLYSAQVIDKHISHGRSTTYYLHLDAWGPLKDTDQISVPFLLYRATDPGDQVCLGLHPGALHIPWYRIDACSVSPDLTQ